MFTWSFSNQKNRSSMWYIIGIIIMGSLVVFGIIMQLYLLSVVAILFSGVYLLIDNNAETVQVVHIDDRRAMVNQSQYLWQNFENFHIIEVNGLPLFLRLIPKGKLATYIDIPFTEEVDTDSLKTFLLTIFPDGKNLEISKTDTLIHLSKM